MGRKRKPRRQGAAARAAARWEELALYHFDLLLCWGPPKNEFEASRSPWQTWAEFVGDWAEVREYVKTECGDGNWGLNPGMIPYAEVLYQIWGAGGPPEDMTFEQVWEAAERWERERRGNEGHDPEASE